MQSLNELKDVILFKLSYSNDVMTRDFTCLNNIKASIIWIENIVDACKINRSVLEPLMETKDSIKGDKADVINIIKLKFEYILDTKIETDLDAVIKWLLCGYCALIIDKQKEIILLNAQNWKTRAISEPPTSPVFKGPREGFVEDICVNLMLIRKRLMTPDLVVESFNEGQYSNSKTCLIYIKSIASDKIIKKVREKLQKINIDGIINSFYIEQYLEDRAYSLFKQIGSTEKPDVFESKLLEGRVGILVNGSPIALTIPYLLLEDIQSNNDYYFSRGLRVTFLRYLRLIGALFAIYLPGIYVAIQIYHYKILPLKFLITISNSSQGIPFTPIVEILFVIVLFEALYEASLRMPRYIGLALSVVGALILGETAVNAGLVSSPTVMIVAMTGVLLYTVPEQESQLSMLRIIATLEGGIIGIYGILLSIVFTIIYLTNFDSYGTPYFAPASPHIKKDQKDALRRVDIQHMITRPKSIPNKNPIRIKMENEDEGTDN